MYVVLAELLVQGAALPREPPMAVLEVGLAQQEGVFQASPGLWTEILKRGATHFESYLPAFLFEKHDQQHVTYVTSLEETGLEPPERCFAAILLPENSPGAAAPAFASQPSEATMTTGSPSSSNARK